ncbi:hypothetical protein K466DRAFT_592920 [Polyporus arcularius HHB13444]|uniref:Uncharacterized protein n=1 Tax=Polyporus arcularius HHB13444 TaxID=1314778 RepID=A0A5C3NN07_9APHY|nr:hypothetical protein K466DRAFT_592920 [Polyporus arcularius HHB13444]
MTATQNRLKKARIASQRDLDIPVAVAVAVQARTMTTSSMSSTRLPGSTAPPRHAPKRPSLSLPRLAHATPPPPPSHWLAYPASSIPSDTHPLPIQGVQRKNVRDGSEDVLLQAGRAIVAN